jgi:catechol 2,3-dioxygenase-like lactoylglutathione lyase family enzyme
VLGRFLELSIRAPDIQASLEFYENLGFFQAEVGEAWAHPYAVVSDGRVCIGLHQIEDPRAMLTFVRPNVLASLPAFESMGVEFEFCRLGADRFNEIGWTVPSGQLIRVVEARTFSPPKPRTAGGSHCGYFLEIGLPVQDLLPAKAYWERFGFVGMDETATPLPHVCCTSDTIDIGLYERGELRATTLLFETDSPAAHMARLAARGFEPAPAVSHRPGGRAAGTFARYIAPEGTAILITGEPAAD